MERIFFFSFGSLIIGSAVGLVDTEGSAVGLVDTECVLFDAQEGVNRDEVFGRV